MTDDDTTFFDDLWRPIAARWSAHGVDALSPEEQAFARVWMLIAEVNNGGLTQYLFNTHGGDGLLAVEGLRQIGAPQLADALRAALEELPGGAPAATLDERQSQIDALDPDARGLERFDDALYAAHRHLWDRMAAFARQHLVAARWPPRELDVVALVGDLPEEGLTHGAQGTIVCVHDGGAAYEVEFSDPAVTEGLGGKLVTLTPDRVLVTWRCP